MHLDRICSEPKSDRTAMTWLFTFVRWQTNANKMHYSLLRFILWPIFHHSFEFLVLQLVLDIYIERVSNKLKNFAYNTSLVAWGFFTKRGRFFRFWGGVTVEVPCKPFQDCFTFLFEGGILLNKNKAVPYAYNQALTWFACFIDFQHTVIWVKLFHTLTVL